MEPIYVVHTAIDLNDAKEVREWAKEDPFVPKPIASFVAACNELFGKQLLAEHDRNADHEARMKMIERLKELEAQQATEEDRIAKQDERDTLASEHDPERIGF